jgi:hypothetical protein
VLPDLVDAERLRETWLEPVPDARTESLLQLAWIRSGAAGDLEQHLDTLVE